MHNDNAVPADQQLLSARFLERIEDELERAEGLPFQNSADVPEWRAHYTDLYNQAVPVLIENYLKSSIEHFIAFETIAFMKGDIKAIPDQDNAVAHIREALPILIKSYRKEKGIPLRMR